ncbi:MAG: DUF427 domain-containing protein [Actinomycetota bacterium]
MRRLDHPEPDPTGPGQESVWSYPRPPALEPSAEHVVIRFGDAVIADTTGSYRVLETSHPPTYYLPPGDVDERFLRPAPGSSFCEWKGSATYFDVVVGDQVLPRAVWAYPTPSQRFVPITGFVSCYPSTLECTVDGELVTAQEGGFYGGWVTSRVVGPFKGTPGSEWW